MNRVASYHTHTVFCDGRDTAEDMVRAAAAGGMSDIGLSAHAAWPFTNEWSMDPERFTEYSAEIARLKAAYRGKIRVLLGFEADYLPGFSAPDPAFYGRFNPDYLIGSVHFVSSGDKRTQAPPWAVDAAASEVARGIEECFAGDGRRAVTAYWGTVREMVESCRFDVVGHLDLPRKRNGELRFFDEGADWYRAELTETVKAIARAGKIVEINTGAIARGAMDDVYPSAELLARLFAAGVPVTINSDAHAARDLTCAYDRARDAARRAGYRTISFLDESGWIQEEF